jgi:hypothetical protein
MKAPTRPRVARRAQWLTATALGLLALGAAPAAQAAPAANALQAKLAVPLPVSAQVLSGNVMEVCFDQPLSGTVTASDFQVWGYDANRVDQAVSSTGVVKGAPDCVDVQFPNAANDAPIAEFTRATVYTGAVKTASGVQNLSGGLALGGTANSPRPGNTAGPDLIGTPTVKTSGTTATITYTFDQALDATPSVVPPHVFNSPTNINNAFGYYTADGTVQSCGNLAAPPASGVSIDGSTVTCTLPAATLVARPPARFYVLGDAVRDRPTAQACCDVNPLGAANVSATATVARPVMVAAKQTGPAQLTVTYSAPVSVHNAGLFTLYSSDGSTIAPTSATQPSGSPTTVVLNFPAALANAAYKAVGIGDPGAAGPSGGAVQSTAPGTPQSATSYVAIRTAPIQAGRVDAPDLAAVSLDPSAGTAVFTFDGLIASAQVPSSFHLLDAYGNAINATGVVGVANTSPTGADPTSQVTVRFPASALATAKAAQVLGSAVSDFAGKKNLRNTVGLSAPIGTTTTGMTVFGHTAFVAPGGTGGVFVGCFSAGTCRGSMQVSAGATVIAARGAFTISGNSGGIVHLQLNRRGRAMIARAFNHHLRVHVTVSGAHGKVSSNLTLVEFAAAGPPVNSARSGNSLLTPFGHTAFVAPNGVVGVFVGCFLATDCHGSLALVSNGVRIGGRDSFIVAAASGGIVHLRIGPAARARLARNGHLTARLTVTGPALATGGPATQESESLALVRFH